jgi:tryptophan halogenase
MNIVIVGGGTAGWIAAYSILKSKKGNHKITLIESSHIGIIGAGEGSTGQLLKLLSGGSSGFVKDRVDINDFMEKTDSINKMGIRYEKWSSPSSSYLAPIATSLTDHNENDYIFKYVVAKFGGEMVHLSSKDGIEYESKKYDEPISFHFDAHKVGAYFKSLCNNEVLSIDAVIKNVNCNENGNVLSVLLDNGQTIAADFFIDCSGFSRVLMKKLDIKWKSCKEYLPVNTAMPFLIQYKKNEEIIPETKATALSAGWMWNIPLKTRRGCGYVFDDNFITHDQAQQEIEKNLGRTIEPIKFIKFDSGYSEYFWKNNVLSLGLSSSFFEPLQATSIHNTIIQLFHFINNFLFDDVNKTLNYNHIDQYNEYIKNLMISSLNLICLNYQGGRLDSDFWKSIHFENKVTDDIKNVIEVYKTKIPKKDMLDMIGHGFGLIDYNIAGLGLVSQDLLYKDLIETNMYDFAEKEWQKYYRAFSYKKT